MICGHCKTQGATIEHVRECSNPTARQTAKSLLAGGPAAIVPAPAAPEPVRATLSQFGDDDAIEGVYMLDGTYIKVQVGTDSRRVYCKSWNGEDSVWDYEGRAPLYRLTRADKVTAEQAAQFGVVTGKCVFCSRKLTDERSIEVGYGPVCAAREGLPWGPQILLDAAPALFE